MIPLTLIYPQAPGLRLSLSTRSAAPARVLAVRCSASATLTSSNGASNNGASSNGAHKWPAAEVPPLSDEVKAILEEKGIDFETSGLKYLTNEARLRSLAAAKKNKAEGTKAMKGGHRMWTEVTELAELIRKGETKWEDLDLDDVDVRLKWSGMFHRRKRAPGTFMMRLKVPNGELSSKQLRFLGDQIAHLGAKGCADITTRANIQLRGMDLADSAAIFEGLQTVGLSAVQTGMDNVRNMTGSPIAGIDPHELLDVRQLNYEINDMITNFGKGNEELVNLPRKLNIGLSPSRDDFPHTHINDVGLKAVHDPETGEVGFNVELGGYFSVKRNTMSIDGDTFLTQDQVVPYCKALLEVFRDHGGRDDRQKARLMWMVEALTVPKFREMVGAQMGGVTLRTKVEEKYDDVWERRDVLGVHPQKQEGFSWVGACVPTGRIFADDFYEFARIADTYGDGTMRLTVEQDVLFPFIPNDKVAAMKEEPIFQKYKIDAGNLTRGLVSCTGAQFCGLAVIETKQRAMAIVEKLEQQMDFPKKIRIHWTGCPNSCGQVQVADIGLMGGPAKLNGKATEGVRVFLGGTIGENPQLANEFEKGIACDESVLLPYLRNLMMEKFGATPKAGVLVEA
ncbi:Ferredoxin-nitrite reductase, chloroplastic [Coccomyxa sp. Obi]|nr:Ferredoxin-nitrite reductase, chloroplastic [Coccomyxa sp. Obi]